jgi:hypothetical protein
VGGECVCVCVCVCVCLRERRERLPINSHGFIMHSPYLPADMGETNEVTNRRVPSSDMPNMVMGRCCASGGGVREGRARGQIQNNSMEISELDRKYTHSMRTYMHGHKLRMHACVRACVCVCVCVCMCGECPSIEYLVLWSDGLVIFPPRLGIRTKPLLGFGVDNFLAIDLPYNHLMATGTRTAATMSESHVETRANKTADGESEKQ